MFVCKNIKQYWTFIVGVIIVLTFKLTVTGVNLKYLPGDLGDARFNNYILEHSHQYFTGQVNSFWNANFMYPEKEVISYSDNLLGSAVFYSFFRCLKIDRETSFQLWFIFLGVLDFVFCYLFLKTVFKNKYSAVLGALIFAISISLHSQLTHAQVFPRFPIPIAFWFCYGFFKTYNPIYFFGILITVVYQFYCGIYLGLLLTVPIIIFFVIFFISRHKNIIKHYNINWLIKIILSFIVSIVAIVPLMLPYYRRSKLLIEDKIYENILHSIATLRSYFYVHNKANPIWSFLYKTGEDYPAFYDHQIFVGGIATVSMFVFVLYIVYSIINKRYLLNKFYSIIGLTAIVTIMFFIRYKGYSLYKYIFEIPGFEAMRSLTRIINIVLIFFAFSTTFVVQVFIFNKQIKYIKTVFCLLVIIICIDNFVISDRIYRTEKSVAQKRVNELVNKMIDIPKNSIVSYEPLDKNTNSIYYHIDAMLATQQLNLKSVNGYSATSPVGFDSFWRNIDSTSRNIWLKQSNLSYSEIIVIR